MNFIRKTQEILTSPGYPGLLFPIVVSIALLEVVASQVPLPLPNSPVIVLHLFIVLIGSLLGLIGYFIGDFWDSTVFDPLYGLRGRWLHSKKGPFHLFPAGSDLQRYRDEAIRARLPQEHRGEGIYRAAKKFVMKETEQWEYIEQPLILSKFIRSFIWPCTLIFVVSILGVIGSFLFDWASHSVVLSGIGVFTFCLGILLFVPYFHLRAEHMIRLYEEASRKEAIYNPDERKVFKAFANSQWKFRTIDGIEKTSGLSREKVLAIIHKYEGTLIHQSSIPDAQGRDLYTLQKDRIEVQEILAQLRTFVSKSLR